MQYNDLLHEIIFLSSMLKIEMIYKPGGVEANMQRALDWLIEHKVLQMSDDGWIGLSDEERSCGRENYGTCHCMNHDLHLLIRSYQKTFYAS